jgi:single-strand DNA-binding protein
MAGETTITVVGNLVDDPELRFTPSGAAVANFRVASTPRKFNKNTSEWEDQDGLFLSCAVWRQAAENVAESLTKGMRVIVTGNLRQENYERDGVRHVAYKMDVTEVGPSLAFATAKVTRAARGAGAGSGQQQSGGQQSGGYSGGGGQQQQPPAQDPWGAPPQGDTPPF